jgi:murein tripeptide amidase MpaA
VATSKSLDASDANQLLLAINPDTRSPHFQWFHFKAAACMWARALVSPEQRQQVLLQQGLDRLQAVASYDHVNWFVPTGLKVRACIQPESRTEARLVRLLRTLQPRTSRLVDRAGADQGRHQLLATGKSVEGVTFSCCAAARAPKASARCGSSPSSTRANTWPSGSWKA